MSLNPFDQQLSEEQQTYSELSTRLNSLTEEVNWYKGINTTQLSEQHAFIVSALEAESSKSHQIEKALQDIHSELVTLSNALGSQWNPFRWLDVRQHRIRSSSKNLQNSAHQMVQELEETKARLHSLSIRSESKIQEMERYENFNFNEKSQEKAEIEKHLEEQATKIKSTRTKQREINQILSPLQSKISRVARLHYFARYQKRRAEDFEKLLDKAQSPNEKTKILNACKSALGESDPKKILLKASFDIQSLEEEQKQIEAQAQDLIRNS